MHTCHSHQVAEQGLHKYEYMTLGQKTHSTVKQLYTETYMLAGALTTCAASLFHQATRQLGSSVALHLG